jgi:hypothetical protein
MSCPVAARLTVSQLLNPLTSAPHMRPRPAQVRETGRAAANRHPPPNRGPACSSAAQAQVTFPGTQTMSARRTATGGPCSARRTADACRQTTARWRCAATRNATTARRPLQTSGCRCGRVIARAGCRHSGASWRRLREPAAPLAADQSDYYGSSRRTCLHRTQCWATGFRYRCELQGCQPLIRQRQAAAMHGDFDRTAVASVSKRVTQAEVACETWERPTGDQQA